MKAVASPLNPVLTAPRRAQVLWVRPMFQLAGSLLVAVAVPYAIAAAITPELLALDLYYVSLAASVLAITLAFWTKRTTPTCCPVNTGTVRVSWKETSRDTSPSSLRTGSDLVVA